MRISDWSSDVCSSDLDLVGWVERCETHHPATLGCGLDDGFRFALPILRCCPTELQVGATPPTASIRRCGTTCLRRPSRLHVRLPPPAPAAGRAAARSRARRWRRRRLRPALPREIGRAHVWTPVTNAQLVCRLLLE